MLLGEAVLELLIKTIFCNILIRNSKGIGPTKTTTVIFEFLDNLLLDNFVIFKKKWWYFWDNAPSMLNFGLGAVSPYVIKIYFVGHKTIWRYNDLPPMSWLSQLATAAIVFLDDGQKETGGRFH